MQTNALTITLSTLRQILAVVGIALVILIGSHAFAQASDKTAVKGTAETATRVQWSKLFSY